MKKLFITAIFASVVISCNSSGGGSLGSVSNLENEDQKAGYAYGMNIGEQVRAYSQSLKEDSLDYAELERGIMDYLKSDKKKRDSYANGQSIGMTIQNFLKTQKLEGKIDEKYIVQGVLDMLNNKTPLFPKDSINPFMRKYIQSNVQRIQTENTEKGKKFLEDKKKSGKVKETASGLLYEVIKEGDGATPTMDNIVEVNYVGKTSDGKTFDSSKKGEPAKFPLRNVIAGWQEGLQLMKVGSKYKFYIPGNLAYGEYGSPDGKIGPNEVLEFEVELLNITEATAQPSQEISPEDLQRIQEQTQQQSGR